MRKKACKDLCELNGKVCIYLQWCNIRIKNITTKAVRKKKQRVHITAKKSRERSISAQRRLISPARDPLMFLGLIPTVV